MFGYIWQIWALSEKKWFWTGSLRFINASLLLEIYQKFYSKRHIQMCICKRKIETCFYEKVPSIIDNKALVYVLVTDVEL